MCDILVVTPEATKSGRMIFAKNSDRDPNEAQTLEYIPKRESEGLNSKLTYIEFPELGSTNEIIISRPWWMWGAEMGVNEHGLVIGNTAVFTKEDYKDTGLLGMDILRLALERRKTARDALGYMCSIIENYGQGGSGSYNHKFLYHNSFIIADDSEAWVLETAGNQWTAELIRGVYSISNTLTIKGDGRVSSSGLVSNAMSKNYVQNQKDFDFSEDYLSSNRYQRFAKGEERRDYTMNKLKQREGDIDIEYMRDILGSHQREPFIPKKGSNKDVCMHYGALSRRSHTASSQVSVIGEDSQSHWFTGTSNPCLSIFKPISFSGGIPNLGREPKNSYDQNNYWWRFEKFHRKFQTNYEKYIPKYKTERDKLQKKLIEKEKNTENKERLTRWAFKKEDDLKKKWESKIEKGRMGILHGFAWKRVNKKADINL